MDILVPTKGIEIIATRHISLPQNILKCFCGRGTAPGDTAEPQSWTWRPLLGGEGKGTGRWKTAEGRKRDAAELRRGSEGIGPKKSRLGLPPEMLLP